MAAFLCVGFIPAEHRDAFLVLRAFNAELALVAERASQRAIAEMRMQWWKDVIEMMYQSDDCPQHPVATSLLQVVRRYHLPKTWLLKIVNERQADLSAKQPQTIGDLEAHCEGTHSTLIYLSLHLLGVQSVHASHAASHIGKALGIALLMRSSAHHVARGQIYHPLQVTEQLVLPTEDILKNSQPEALQQATFEVCQIAEEHLAIARSTRQVPKQGIPALMTAAIADLHLRQLARADYNVFDTVMQDRYYLPLQLQLLKSYVRGKF